MAPTRRLVREEIIRVAAECFSQRGYQNTTLEEIVSRVGISRVTFYTYFESKAALLKTIFERLVKAYRKGLEEILAKPLPRPEKLREVVTHQVRSLTEDQPLIRLFFREEANLPEEAARFIAERQREIEQLLEEEIAKGIEKGEIIKENPRLLMYAFMGMCGWLYRWYHPGNSAAPEEIVRVFTRVLESGSLTPKAKQQHYTLARRLQKVEKSLQRIWEDLKKVEKELSLNHHSR